MSTPLPLRKLKALMVLKGLTVATVAKRTGIPYTTTSELLNGARTNARRLSKISAFIENAPGPRMTVAA